MSGDAEALDRSGRPVGSCNCASYGNAAKCPVHTQEDYDASEAAMGRPVSGDAEALGKILDALEAEDDYVRSWKLARQIRAALAAHDAAVRDRAVAEALAPVRALASFWVALGHRTYRVVDAAALRAALPDEPEGSPS